MRKLLLLAASIAAIGANASADTPGVDSSTPAIAATAPATNADVLARATRAMDSYFDAWTLRREPAFADSAVLEYPIARPGLVLKAEGKQAIMQRIQARAEFADNWQFSKVRVFPTLQSDMVVVQYEASAEDFTSGKTLSQLYVAFVKMQDNEIVSFQEFSNPAGTLSALANNQPFVGTTKEIRK